MKLLQEQYLELFKMVLTDYQRVGFGEYRPLSKKNTDRLTILMIFLNKILKLKKCAICKHIEYDPENIINGKWLPPTAETLIGMKRLNNIQECFMDVVDNNIEGDLIETGVWKGGATIFMRALLNVFEVKDKIVWVADSFEGLPKPNAEKYKADKDSIYHTIDELAIPLDRVKRNFQKYGLLDHQVRFLRGWFKDTLPNAPIKKLCLLRLDGDMYESTMDALVHLYPKLSRGGYLIVDDWAIKNCRLAVEHYRRQCNITEEIKSIDWTGVYWKKRNDV